MVHCAVRSVRVLSFLSMLGSRTQPVFLLILFSTKTFRPPPYWAVASLKAGKDPGHSLAVFLFDFVINKKRLPRKKQSKQAKTTYIHIYKIPALAAPEPPHEQEQRGTSDLAEILKSRPHSDFT